ncbi:MAG: hypothetical protein ACYYKD_12685 [Rhodospirillales bacterium]
MRARVFTIAVLVLGLGACEVALRPFQHLEPPGEGALSTPGRESAGVEVALRGGAKPAAAAMARLTARAMLARGLPAAPAPAFDQGWTFEGLVTRGSAPGAFTAARIHWTLRERGGRWAGAHTQDVPGARAGWDRASPAMLAAAAEAAAAAAADLLRAGEAGPGPEAAEWGVWVAPVTGADDEDSQALARALGPALRLALGAVGAPVRETETGAAAKILGRAEVTPADADGDGDSDGDSYGDSGTGGGARVVIVWEVLDSGGKSAGTALQDNTLPRSGPLSGPPGGWGETAALAAAAAVDVLADLTRRVR